MQKEEKQYKHLAEPSEAQKKKPSLLAQVWSYVWPAAVCAAVLLVINTYFIFYATVPTESMKNLIQKDSYILANRMAYMNRAVNRGDVIVFEQDERFLVKRVIAVAGDEVVLNGGSVYLNGEKLDESAYVLGHTYAFKERNAFTVPENCVLLFGDNRDNSQDARLWKDPYVSLDDVVGRVFCVFSFRDGYFVTL